MTIPGSFLSAILHPAVPAVQQTAKSLVQGAARAFGELVQPSPVSDNGPSETSFDDPRKPTLGLSPRGKGGLQDQLTQWVRGIANRLGLSDSQPEVAIIADGVGIPRVEGPENLTRALQESLEREPELVEAINRSARETFESDPLQWMPGHEPRVRWAIPRQS
ncbi:MAG: hypothetical protein ACK57G_12995 [Planctomycetota bacterium]|jgi:hypothetical protein